MRPPYIINNNSQLEKGLLFSFGHPIPTLQRHMIQVEIPKYFKCWWNPDSKFVIFLLFAVKRKILSSDFDPFLAELL